MSVIQKFIQPIVEKNSFGVCSYLAQKWGLSESTVRMYFVYTSFASFGSPIIFYLAIAFWINIKKYIRSGLRVQ